MEFIADESNGGYRGQTKEWIKLELINGAVSRKYYKALQGAYLVPLGGKKPGHNRKPVGQSYDAYSLGEYRYYLDTGGWWPIKNYEDIVEFVSIATDAGGRRQYHDTYDPRPDNLVIICDDGYKIRVKEIFRFILSKEDFFLIPNGDGSTTRLSPFLDFAKRGTGSDYFKTIKSMLQADRVFFCQNPQGKSDNFIKRAFGFERAKRTLKKKFLATISLHSALSGDEILNHPAIPGYTTALSLLIKKGNKLRVEIYYIGMDTAFDGISQRLREYTYKEEITLKDELTEIVLWADDRTINYYERWWGIGIFSQSRSPKKKIIIPPKYWHFARLQAPSRYKNIREKLDADLFLNDYNAPAYVYNMTGARWQGDDLEVLKKWYWYSWEEEK